MELKRNHLYKTKVRFIPEVAPGTLLYYQGSDVNPHDGVEQVYFKNAGTGQGYTWVADYNEANRLASYLEEVIALPT